MCCATVVVSALLSRALSVLRFLLSASAHVCGMMQQRRQDREELFGRCAHVDTGGQGGRVLGVVLARVQAAACPRAFRAACTCWCLLVTELGRSCSYSSLDWARKNAALSAPLPRRQYPTTAWFWAHRARWSRRLRQSRFKGSSALPRAT